MRLERLTVGGFGALRPGLELGFAPGFNVLAAPNEYGKTTLAELITGMFYGFGNRKAGVHPFEPWQGADSVGGELRYRLADGRGFVLSRHLLARGQRLKLSDQAGGEVACGRAEPGVLHLGCGRGVFITVARVGLDDLREAFSGQPGKERKESEQQLLGFFYREAATKGEVANPVSVLAGWVKEQSGLYSPDRRSGKADLALVGEIAQAQDGRLRAVEREEQAKEAAAGLEEAEQQVAAVAEQRSAAEAELRAADKQLARARAVARLNQVQAEIAELSRAGLADEKLDRRLWELDRAAAGAEQRAERAAGQAAGAVAREIRLTGGRPAEEMEAALDGLSQRAAAAGARAEELGRRRAAVNSRAEEMRRHWGSPPAELARLGRERIIRLAELREELSRAREDFAALDAEQAGDNEGMRKWISLLESAGLGLSGLVLVLWWVLAREAWPALIAGGVAVGAGGLLLARWLRGSRGSGLMLRERHERLGRSFAGLQAEWTALEQELGKTIASADPHELAGAQASAAALVVESRELDRAGAEVEAWLEELWAELKKLGHSEDYPRLDQALVGVRRRCREAVAAGREAAQSTAQAESERARAEAMRAELAGLLQEHGLADLEALGQAHARWQRVGQLQALARELGEQLAGATSGPAMEVAEAEALAQRARGWLAELDRRIRELEGRRGELRRQMEHLLSGVSAAEAEARLGGLEQRRRELAHRHDLLLVAGELLSRAMNHYRLEAQPGLMRGAARYLEMATAGAYGWLGTDMFSDQRSGKPDITTRAGAGEMEREAEVLSRGTRDQIYLCLRLALADELSQGREPLPLILDDPLVNFDDRRTEGTLAMLAAIAEQRQVILLTCHHGLAELARGRYRAAELDLTESEKG